MLTSKLHCHCVWCRGVELAAHGVAGMSGCYITTAPTAAAAGLLPAFLRLSHSVQSYPVSLLSGLYAPKPLATRVKGTDP